MNSSYKQNVADIVGYLLLSLDNFDKLTLNNVTDKQLIKSFENIKNTMSEGMFKIKYHLEALSKTAEWDKLNVAFFGETNAGKSTVIEALINGNGKSIGDGRKDFTKTVNLYSYQNINLIDMPGIEGEEKKVIRNIQEAINKSHIVFYVIGTNKEPEKKTISKIKGFLKGEAKVFSIINVRGKADVYRYKRKLKDANTIKIENRVKKKFQEILGNNYAGNVVINAYLAFLKSNRIMDKFKKDKSKALKIFGSESEIERFSNIQEVYKILNIFQQNIRNEIIISNTYKFLKSINIMLSKILKEKKKFDIALKNLNDLIEQHFDDIEEIVRKYEVEIIHSLEVNANSLRVKLKEEVTEGINNKDDETTLKKRLNDIQDLYKRKFSEQVEELLSCMRKEIEGKIKEFEDRLSLQIQFLDLKDNFKLKNILELLKADFKYIFSQILDIISSIVGVLAAFAINPVVGIITTIFAITRKIWEWFFSDPDERKYKAKNKAIEEIDSMVNAAKRKTEQNLEKKIKKIKKDIRVPFIKLREKMKGIKKISRNIDSKIGEIKKAQTELSTLLAKEVLGNNVKFSYLDLQLSRAVVIGYKEEKGNVKDQLLKIFRLKDINLYPSYQEWLNDAGECAENGVFIVKDEFNYRAISSLTLNSIEKVEFKRVKKEAL